jgi:hypothetical protein
MNGHSKTSVKNQSKSETSFSRQNETKSYVEIREIRTPDTGFFSKLRQQSSKALRQKPINLKPKEADQVATEIARIARKNWGEVQPA